ncbi:MAG TPA: hypothetical protein VFV08_14760 [Puia sp.]|nr:hypothetical protein [Puia sp.]
MSLFSNTGWSYKTSSGVSATGGEILEITAGQARLYMSDPDGNVFKVIGTGIGFGVGISALPASVAGSITDMPSTGTDVYGLLTNQLDINDFSSFMVIYSANAVVSSGLPLAPAGSGCMGLFVHLDAIQKASLALAVLSPTGLIGVLASLTSAFKAVCFFAGVQVSTAQLGVDATGTAYWISSADPVS